MSDSIGVNGMTRDEFESHLRVCYQHDNVRAHVNASEGFKLTEEQERAVSERAELNYPAAISCPGCRAWKSGMSEVAFVQGCPGCAKNMRVANGLEVAAHTEGADTRSVASKEPVFWWNGIREYDERDGSARSISDVENTWHDIPLYAGTNPHNLAILGAERSEKTSVASHEEFEAKMRGYCDPSRVDTLFVREGNAYQDLSISLAWHAWEEALTTRDAVEDARPVAIVPSAEYTQGWQDSADDPRP